MPIKGKKAFYLRHMNFYLYSNPMGTPEDKTGFSLKD